MKVDLGSKKLTRQSLTITWNRLHWNSRLADGISYYMEISKNDKNERDRKRTGCGRRENILWVKEPVFRRSAKVYGSISHIKYDFSHLTLPCSSLTQPWSENCISYKWRLYVARKREYWPPLRLPQVKLQPEVESECRCKEVGSIG